MFSNRIHYDAYIVVSMWKHLFKLVCGAFHLLYNPRCFATVHTGIHVIAIERDGGIDGPSDRQRGKTRSGLRKRMEGQNFVPTSLSVREYSCATYNIENKVFIKPEIMFCIATLRSNFIPMYLTKNAYQLALSPMVSIHTNCYYLLK